jgi:hypothetical protein
MRKLSDPLVASHLLFVLNALFWYWADSIPCALLLLASCGASTGHHLTRESNVLMRRVDVSFAVWALVGTVSYSFAFMGPHEMATCAALLGSALAIKKWGDRRGPYRRWHTLWHVMVFVGQAYLAYISGAFASLAR